MSDSEGLVRIGELSRAVGMSANWLRQLADDGEIPAHRTVGGQRRFDVEAVRAALVRRNSLDHHRTRRAVSVEPNAAPIWDRTYSLTGLAEDKVWRDLIADTGLDQTDSAGRVMNYTFTEMLNNAIDHSDATTVRMRFWLTPTLAAFAITDDGVGVFARLRTGLALEDDLQSIQELSKGKRTTAPDRHTGEGIFFSSKAADLFQLASNRFRWTVDNVRGDAAVGDAGKQTGTTVYAQITRTTDRTLAALFKQFTDDDNDFVRTRPAVKLFGMGLSFVSRSEARRLLESTDDFNEIEVDFTGVEDVGQGFVDELLRVWPSQNPGKRVIPINMSPAVEFMISRGLPRPSH